ncbi:MAG: hypothetical protein KKA19_03650 [Candidatus Margulisbacteria bacterium]|nr:hypothetical protein [Candidatus Margulisiibacteriota bacterium]
MAKEKFSAYEVIEIAIEMEKSGAALYHELSAAEKVMTISEVFQKLEADKQKLITQYEKLLKKVSKEAPQEAYPGEYILYLKSLADEHVISPEKAKEALIKINTPSDALDLAINFKKSSLLYLKELEGCVSKEDDKVVKELIKKKQADLNNLLDLKKKYK